MKKIPAIGSLFAIIVILSATAYFLFLSKGASEKKPDAKEEPQRLLAAPSVATLPPIQNKEKEDTYHNTYRITETVTNSPYTSQTLFRGDVLSWTGDVVKIDVGSSRVDVRIPGEIFLFCRNAKYPDGKLVRENQIIWLPEDRKRGAPVALSKIKELFPVGSKDMIVAADITTTGEKTGYLITHIGCADAGYPVKIP